MLRSRPRLCMPLRRCNTLGGNQQDRGFFGTPAAFGGISFYWTGSPNAPVPHNVGVGQRNGVVPAIFDTNVWRVEFTWGVGVFNGSVEADFTFQIFGWG
jgi:hypothetical protein